MFCQQTVALCITLRRLAYPNRYFDMANIFPRSIPELNQIFIATANLLIARHGFLLRDLDQPWLSAERLQEMAEAVRDKGAALANCWGFIDGKRQLNLTFF